MQSVGYHCSQSNMSSPSLVSSISFWYPITLEILLVWFLPRLSWVSSSFFGLTFILDFKIVFGDPFLVSIRRCRNWASVNSSRLIKTRLSHPIIQMSIDLTYGTFGISRMKYFQLNHAISTFSNFLTIDNSLLYPTMIPSRLRTIIYEWKKDCEAFPDQAFLLINKSLHKDQHELEHLQALSKILPRTLKHKLWTV